MKEGTRGAGAASRLRKIIGSEKKVDHLGGDESKQNSIINNILLLCKCVLLLLFMAALHQYTESLSDVFWIVAAKVFFPSKETEILSLSGCGPVGHLPVTPPE